MDEILDNDVRRMVDLPTLLIVIFGGFYLGLLGGFNIDILTAVFGGAGARIVQTLIGLCALWQVYRQRLG
jgi:uncharacterized membrane protein YuzA (DUF378 family)